MEFGVGGRWRWCQFSFEHLIIHQMDGVCLAAADGLHAGWGCVSAGFMTREERKKFEGLECPYNKYWIPCVWFTNLVAAARSEGRIKDDGTLKLLLEVRTHARTHEHACACTRKQAQARTHTGTHTHRHTHTHTHTQPYKHTHTCVGSHCRLSASNQELNDFRGNCSMLFHYDMISVPLVYTQVHILRFTPSTSIQICLLAWLN